jgi:hypothetical protein
MARYAALTITARMAMALNWSLKCREIRGEFLSALNTAVPIGPTAAIGAQPTARCRALVTWFVPDLALTFALTTLFALFFIFGGATSLFIDSDTGWHIRNGERIVSTGLLPHTDPFSFSKTGEPWVAWEWGADVLMGAACRIAGLGGVALIFGLCIGASVWMWFRLNRASGGNFLLACVFFVPMLSTTTLHWLARPHVFSWLFLLGTMWSCERMPSRIRWLHLGLAALAAAAWANVHPSFFFAPLIALVYAAGAYLNPLIWHAGGPAIRARSYILPALAALAGTFANPNGWRLHQHVFSYLLDFKLLARITEYQSFDFQQEGGLRVMLALALCFTGGLAALVAHKPARFLLSMLLVGLALRSARSLPVAALLLLPLANGSIIAVISRPGNLTKAFRRKLDAALDYGDRLQAIERRFHGLAVVPLVAALIFFSIRARAGFPAGELPIAASEMVASLPPSARILAPDLFGGYLVFRFNGSRRVFIDGRSDFYGAEFLENYLRLVEVRPGWRGEFNRWNFTHALLPPDYPLVFALEAGGWRELYRDNTAVLLTGKSRL